MKKTTTILTCILLLFAFSSTNVEAQKLKDLWKKTKKEAKKVTDEAGKLLKKKKDRKNKKEETIKNGNDGSNILKLNPSDFITFNSPNNDFNSINIQKHKGLPRIGDINSYGAYIKRGNEKNTLIGKLDIDQVNFFEMIKAKYYINSFEKIDKKILYSGRYQRDDPKAAYKIAQSNVQNYIKDLAYSLVSVSGKKKYFTNSNDGYGGRGMSKEWGGHSSDEFGQTEIYRDFAENNLDLLINWTNSFFENNQQEFYFVQALKVGTYNFEEEGYIIGRGNRFLNHKTLSLNTRNRGNIRSPFGIYIEQNEFEYLPNNDAVFDYGLLLRMSPDKAKNLKEKLFDYSTSPSSNRDVVFMVRKIKMQTVKKRRTLKSKNTPQKTQEQEFSYSYSEPFAEIYADEALTDKLGTITFFGNNTNSSNKSNKSTQQGNNTQQLKKQINNQTNTTQRSTPITQEKTGNANISKEEIERYESNFSKMQADALNIAFTEKFPIFPDCEGLSEKETRICFVKSLNEHYRANYYNPTNVVYGRTRITGNFIINTMGEVVGIMVHDAAAPAPEIKAMVVDIIRKLPKFKPAVNKGKKVNVTTRFLFQFPLK